MRLYLFLLTLPMALLLAACGTAGTAPDLFDDAGAPGFAEKHAVDYLYQELRSEQQGWQVWELADKEQVTCMAIKPAKGKSWPSFSSDWRLTFNRNYQTLHGGAGFFMYVVDEGNIPYYGFYGEQPYRWLSVAEKDGQRITDTNDQVTVLSWEGAEVNFQVDTQPDQFDSGQAHTASGTVDFTGITQAHADMLACHARIARR